MADHREDDGRGDVIDRPGDEGASMEAEIEDQTMAKEANDEGAEVAGDGSAGNDEAPEVEDKAVRHALEEDPHALEETGAVGPNV
ncbi:hypothetical protein RHMOL_Rhmol05G0168800 [Rhododendron molle]|uniref:Uncharacterized protein n=1 Tax=Rhododendron molle TaxID=49168 RepID=A0ACC0NQ37_RHOML|nr:hypothetical protein RHMOL_Rhmol05G0168800 [Rhododendron molle]